ncbi:MAG TPA: hypothetical protein VKR79_10270 [Gaiellaceae bacterium]|nr:hypothetical protein [Gaiellaceae bacterium]
MRIALLVTLFASLAVAMLAGASSAALPAPTGLHGFMLVANEPSTTTFHQTPSFAWKPVSGAERYELQLSLSSTFRDSGLLYDSRNLFTPVAAPPLTLPWITGSPHSLYARVRALFGGDKVSAWSQPFGFDVVAPAAPAQLASYPGLLRWNTVDGADAYEVWLIDKLPVTQQIEVVRTNVLDERDFYGASWPTTVRWRVRALRVDVFGAQNGIPAASYGPWSPVYESSNTAPVDGAITLTGTLSDSFSDGSRTSAAHELMPSFLWTGDQTLDGTVAPFFRVYVFTDSQCLNPVYVGPAVASPAYAPRVSGLALPPNDANAFVDPDAPTVNVGLDGDVVVPNEQLAPATPTVGPSASGAAVTAAAVIGSPLDLWDVGWPDSGYYWTVVGVQQVGGPGGVFQDLELPQDVCAAGRIQRLGISSEPSLTSKQQPFATGLSSKGRLVSAAQTPKFYGQPLVAWTAALGASNYEVQWARSAYPFAARGSSYTFGTSAVLPLKPGTWWYRVRGFDYNLPTGAQQMAWSQPTKLVVTKPTFRVTTVTHRSRSKFKVVKK